MEYKFVNKNRVFLFFSSLNLSLVEESTRVKVSFVSKTFAKECQEDFCHDQTDKPGPDPDVRFVNIPGSGSSNSAGDSSGSNGGEGPSAEYLLKIAKEKCLTQAAANDEICKAEAEATVELHMFECTNGYTNSMIKSILNRVQIDPDLLEVITQCTPKNIKVKLKREVVCTALNRKNKDDCTDWYGPS